MPARDLAGLRELLLSAKELTDITDGFMSWFEAAPSDALRVRLGRPPMLRELVVRAARETFGPAAEVTHDAWFAHPSEPFVHGGFLIAEWIGAALYFADLRMGLISFSHLNGRVLSARFTLVDEPPGDPSRN